MDTANSIFITNVVNGINPGLAYKAAYKNDKVNNRRAHKIMKTDIEINQGIKEQLAHQGVTINKVNKVLKRQLDATKVIYYDSKLSRDIVPDNDAQLKAATTAYKLYGVLKDKDVIIDNRSVTFSGDVNTLAKVIKEMKEIDSRQAIDTDGEVV